VAFAVIVQNVFEPQNNYPSVQYFEVFICITGISVENPGGEQSRISFDRMVHSLILFSEGLRYNSAFSEGRKIREVYLLAYAHTEAKVSLRTWLKN